MKTPFLWAGSKDKNYKCIKDYVPEFDTYFEPFLGGGSIYFRLLAARGKLKAYCSDINDDLVNTYEVMRDDPDELINRLPEKKDRGIFNSLLKEQPTKKVDRAVRFLYLNRNRFFGMGGWMAADRFARKAVCERISYFSPLMASTTFSSAGCWSLPAPSECDFTFCDPPYPDTNNKACYSVGDGSIMDLNLSYLSSLSETKSQFLFITKYSTEIEQHAMSLNYVIEKKEWSFRKPGKGVQYSHEAYIQDRDKVMVRFNV